jgi:hypothetical protein
MTWKEYVLPDGDAKAHKHFLKSFSIGAPNHALTKRLIQRLVNAKGPMFAIAMESLDLERVVDFRWAGTYSGGKQWHEAAHSPTFPVGNSPLDGLGLFLDTYLRSSQRAIVLCENWINTRSEIPNLLMRESRTVFHGDEVYHILSSSDAGNLEFISTTVWEAKNQWLTGVCSSAELVPQVEIPSEAFFDEIVANVAHIFVSAFDEEGYLVWSPNSSDSGG